MLYFCVFRKTKIIALKLRFGKKKKFQFELSAVNLRLPHKSPYHTKKPTCYIDKS